MFRTVCHRPTLWEVLLPPEALVMPPELAAVDHLLDDPRFFEPFRRWFDPLFGRPSIPMETYLRMMFLKYRYRLGYEPLCREVADSIAWRRFCRVPLDRPAPHPTTLMKIISRCGERAVAGLNDALLDKAAENKGPYAFQWGERVRMRGALGRVGHVTPPAWSRTRRR